MNKINSKELLKKYGENSPSKWKRSGFAMLPHTLLFDPRAKLPALMVFWILTVHMFRGKNKCFPSLKTLEEETRLSRNTVLKGIRILKEMGYLQVEGGKKTGKPNNYYLKAKI